MCINSTERIFKNKERDFELVDIHVYEENDQFYLSATYRGEDKKEEFEILLPKIKLPIRKYELTLDIESSAYSALYSKTREVLVRYPDAGCLKLGGDEKGNLYYKKVLKEKKREMTIAEIEKELGYSVKIVSKK